MPLQWRSNVGAAAVGDITAVATTGMWAKLPLSISINETVPATGAILGDHVLQNVGAGANRTVAWSLDLQWLRQL